MLYDFKTLAADLQDATITYTSETITIMFRSRDRLTHELKKALSHAVKVPVHFMFQSKQGFKQEWWFHGSHHNPFGGAALQTITDTHYLEHHYDKHGWAGCDYGPSKIEHHYGKSYTEEWITTTGDYHREGDPAKIRIEYHLPTTSNKTSFTTRELEWFQSGKRFNGDSWSHLLDVNGMETFETASNGFIRTLQVANRTLQWFNERGELHRTDGPAYLQLSTFKEIEKDGKITWRWRGWHGDWRINDKEIPYGDILKWSKRHNILMWNEPCYDRSAFRTDDGEVLFITDFAGAKR
jgi:hypothetical protein